MKNILCLLCLLLLPLSGSALSLPLQSPEKPAPVPLFTLSGTLERRVAIGGETTGWALRLDRKQRLELVLPSDAPAWVREGLVVSVTGVHGTKRYPERGDVPVFIVHQISRGQN